MTTGPTGISLKYINLNQNCTITQYFSEFKTTTIPIYDFSSSGCIGPTGIGIIDIKINPCGDIDGYYDGDIIQRFGKIVATGVTGIYGVTGYHIDYGITGSTGLAGNIGPTGSFGNIPHYQGSGYYYIPSDVNVTFPIDLLRMPYTYQNSLGATILSDDINLISIYDCAIFSNGTFFPYFNGVDIYDIDNTVFIGNVDTTDSIILNSANVNIGFNVGLYNQGVGCVAIGFYSGNTSQGSYNISIGNFSGADSQANSSISLGSNTNSFNYNNNYNSISLGNFCGYSNQSQSCIAISNSSNGAGVDSQDMFSIAIGDSAGLYTQQRYSVAIGNNVGVNNFGISSVGIGYDNSDSSMNNVNIGYKCGFTNQNFNTVAIGAYAGYNEQNEDCIAIGNNCGYELQDVASIAIGSNSGLLKQSSNSIAIGYMSGLDNQSFNSVAIGYQSGFQNQGNFCIAIGNEVGKNNQDNSSIVIGSTSGSFASENSIIIGSNSGYSCGKNTIIIGQNITPNSIIENAFFVVPDLLPCNLGATLLYDVVNGQIGPTISSKRFKTNIKPLNDDFCINVDKLQAKKYNTNSIGLIAEEVYHLYPEIVNLDKDKKPYSLNYSLLNVILLKQLQIILKNLN